jgi:putative nucleotidyltransferase with HDIG domain
VAKPSPEVQLAADIERAVLRDLQADRLQLPAMPDAAYRTVELLNDPDYKVEAVTKIIEGDVLLAAQLVKLVNSAAFGGLQAITSIRECVARLGARELRAFLFEISARQLMESRDPRIAEVCRGLWEHSLAVALLSRDIAAHADARQAEPAYLAGLLHDVGKPLLAALLVAAENRLLNKRTPIWLPAQTLEFIMDKHRSVGRALATRWKLPEVVGHTIEGCSVYQPAEPRSLLNAVSLANALAKLAGLYVGRFDWEEVAAFSFMGQQLFQIDDASIERIITGVKAQLGRRGAA